jgi:integrase
MKGSLVNRNGHYSVVLEDKDPVTGKRKQRWVKAGDDYKKAQKELTRLVNDYNNGNFVMPSKNTLAEYLNEWLNDCIKPNLSIRTYELYELMSRKHIIPAIGSVTLTNLKPQHLQRLYADSLKSGLSSRTTQLIHITMHKALKNAVKTGMLNRNVAEAVNAPKVQHREMKVMNETDYHLFLDFAKDSEFYPLFYLALFTGLRRGELIALKWEHVDLLGMALSVVQTAQQLHKVAPDKRVIFKDTKTQGSRRSVDLPPSVCIMLREHMESRKRYLKSLNPDFDPEKDFDKSELIFCRYDGSPLRPDSVTHAWKKLVRKCGLAGVRLHDARHSHASLMLKQGANIKVVSERLGHSNVSITLNLYAHVLPGMQLAAANRFDDIIAGKSETLPEKTVR